MNRRQRRAARDRRRLAEVVERAAACPDCCSDVAVVEVTPRYYRGVVRHDPTCPFFAALTRNRKEAP